MIIILNIALAICVFAMLYLIIPIVKVRKRIESTELASESLKQLQLKILNKSVYIKVFIKHVEIKIIQAGLDAKINAFEWIILSITALIITIWFAINSGTNIVTSAFVGIFVTAYMQLYLYSKAEKNKKIFQKNLYKIYSFLNLQISSGIKTTEAIKGMYSIVNDTKLSNVLKKVTSQLELTFSIEDSLKIIKDTYDSHEANMLCLCITQCLMTGNIGDTLKKMESATFNKYFYMLQQETIKFRKKLVISAVLMSSPLIFIFLFPIIYDAFKGFSSLMNIN